MFEFALEQVAHESLQLINGLPRLMVETWPNEIALSVPFTMTSAAVEYENTLANKSEYCNAVIKLAALLSADIFAVQTFQPTVVYASDLRAYWLERDPYFINL